FCRRGSAIVAIGRRRHRRRFVGDRARHAWRRRAVDGGFHAGVFRGGGGVGGVGVFLLAPVSNGGRRSGGTSGRGRGRGVTRRHASRAVPRKPVAST